MFLIRKKKATKAIRVNKKSDSFSIPINWWMALNFLLFARKSPSIANIKTGTTAANGSTSAIAGILGGYTFNPTAGGVQVGNRFVVTNSPTTTANTAVGEIIRIGITSRHDNFAWH